MVASADDQAAVDNSLPAAGGGAPPRPDVDARSAAIRRSVSPPPKNPSGKATFTKTTVTTPRFAISKGRARCAHIMTSRFGIKIRRDVCLLPASNCNGASSVQLRFVPRGHVAEGRRVVTLSGTTVALYAKHHETSDWSDMLLN